MSWRKALAWPLVWMVFPFVGAASGQEGKVIRGAQVGAPVRPRSVDVDLRDLPRVREWEAGDSIKEIPRRAYPRPGQTARSAVEGQDPLLDQQALAEPIFEAAFSSPLTSFNGQGFSGVNPPDTVGDVGPNHYIQMINHSSGASFVVYDKTGAVVAGPTLLDTLGTGNCASGLGDPVVLYDGLAGRWLLSEFSNSGNQLCVYVSKTSNPVSGGWWAYAFTAPSFPDYPKYGVWPDAYYVSSNEGTGSPVYALDRANMLNGAAARGLQRFTAPDMSGFSFQALTPADLDGATAPPAGAPAIYARHRDDEVHGGSNPSNDFIDLWEFHVDWTTPANSTFTQLSSVAVAEFSSDLCGLTSFACVPQPGTTTRLDPLREVIMFRLQYRNFGSHQTLAGNFVTDVNGADLHGIRWFELRKTTSGWFLQQQGTYSPDGTHRWMGSAAMDGAGNFAVAYNASAATSVFPGIRYAGRLATDAAGTLPQGENTLVSGTAANGSNRYGDYAALTVDPADDCTFWFTGEYNPSSSWSTRIGSFKFDACGGTPTPDFSVSCSPSSVTVAQGGSTTSTCTVSSANGFASAVGLACTGMPSGSTCSFSPGSVTPPANGTANSTLTVSASAAAATGTFGVQVAGTSGSTTRTTNLSLTVNPTGGGGAQTAVFDTTLQVPKCATVGISCDASTLVNGRDGKGPEPNQPNTINDSCADGTSGTYHSDESNDRLKVLTTDGTNFAPGKTVRIEATVWAWSTPSADKLDLYYAANANGPTWTFLTTLTPTVGGTQTLSATYTLPTGALQAVRANFRYQGTASACSTGAYDDHDDLVFAVSGGAGDTTPPATSITSPLGGATVSGAITVAASASDAVGVTKVEFYLDGALQSTDTTSPYQWPWNTATASNGSHNLQSRAYDAANNVGTSATVSVTVNNVVVVSAVYDSVLKAPKCATVGSGCDSGTLVNGRDGKGPEPNQPNTINTSCADGTSGTYHSDESNDKLRVVTTDGSAMAAGKTVRIEATVWAWSTPSSDKLDLYYAANANSPAWTFLATLTPTVAGSQVLSATYTLPAGALQAVRAQFRYQGSASACTAGAYNDRDDLIFAVP